MMCVIWGFIVHILYKDDHDVMRLQCAMDTDIGKSIGPRSSTGENSGGPMKTLIVLVLLSGKKFM